MQHRIVSLIPSATEIVWALGFEECLVGRSHECDFPPEVQRLTVCSEPKIDVRGSSREIDDRVNAALREATSVYRVFQEELERLQPTVVITQSQCDVCAVSRKDVEAAVCEMVGSRPDVVSLEPMQLADVWDDIQRVAQALQADRRGQELVVELQTRLQCVASAVGLIENRPTVACIEWLEPLMSAGNWIPELVAIAGGTPLLSEAGKHSPWITWDDLHAADPDVIVVMPCGFRIPRIESELNLLTEHSGWRELQAVRNRQVFLVDGNQYFNRPGPRLVESAEILAEILHGPSVNFGHEGTGWQHMC